LLFSNYSALLPALPFAFFTPSLNYVASITLRNEPPPTGLQLTKWYFGPQVDEMKAKLVEVKELGAATAEEWSKGLEADGKEKAADAARWEQWELAGGFQGIAQSIFEDRQSQRPVQEPNQRLSFATENRGSAPFGFPGMNGNSTNRSMHNAQNYPWTFQGRDSCFTF
jgi:hypothetical protein